MKEFRKFGENAEIVYCLIMKLGKKNYTEKERKLAMIHKVSEEPRALGLTAYGLVNQNDMYWNCEDKQWERNENGVKPIELCFSKPQVVSFCGESLRSCFMINSAKN